MYWSEVEIVLCAWLSSFSIGFIHADCLVKPSMKRGVK